MVRGSSRTQQMGRRGRPPKPSSDSVSKQTESRKSRYQTSNTDDLSTSRSNNSQLTNNTTPQRSTRESARLTNRNSLIKSNSNSVNTKKQQQTQSNNKSASRSSRTRTTKKRKSTKWDDDSTDEDDYLQPAAKRRGAYLEAYQSSSYYDDEQNEEQDEETEDDYEEDAEDSLDNDLTIDQTTTSIDKNFLWERTQRPNSPPRFADEENLPRLELPETSQDLLLTDEDVDDYLMQICSVYEILKHFKNQLRLSPFRIEEFIAALQLDEMNSLCSEIHITLLKVLIKEDEANNTIIGSNEIKDSVNIHLYACDTITWPQVLKMYLLARAKGSLLTQNKINEHSGDIEAKRVVQRIYKTSYPIGTDLKDKLLVLQYLCDSFLETNIAREEILNIESMTIKHDDHCRKCHKPGDLLCCDNCPAVFCPGCAEPPLNSIPNNEWICQICKAMNIEEIEGATVRKEILGWDRHGRKYWWLCQRLIVEEENENKPNKVYYYSTRVQFNELMQALDKSKYEKELFGVLTDMTDELYKGFDQINQLTQNAIVLKGLMLHHVKSWIELCNEEAKAKEELNSQQQATAASETTTTGGIVTRTKTGAINQVTKQTNENGIVTKNLDAEDQNILYIWDNEKDDRYLRRMNKKYIPNLSSLQFKLGMEAKTYSNYFNINILALNKHQHQEERDKRRQLSWKFSFTPASEFKWLGATNCSHNTLIQTLRKTFIQFENNLQSPFLHPNWLLHRNNWLAAIQLSNNAKDFALALSILESSIKPVLFNPCWNDALGHLLLERTTLFDREERKKIEKRERREQSEEFDMLMRLGGVKYSLIPNRLKDGVWSGQGVGRGVHQLWKQRGEEYRVTGKNGWMWRSSTRVHYKCKSKKEILKTEELTEEEQEKVANTATINIMRELRLTDKKRIYYPKIFNKKSCPKLELIENLLEKRIALQKAIELEKEKDKKSTDEKLDLSCYSSDCQNLKSDSSKERTLKCYSIDCRKETNKLIEDNEEEIEKEINEIFYCVKPVYLYNVNERNEIQRRLNTKRLFGKGTLPPCSRFTTKSGKKSIFVLPNYELRKLARNAALREAQGFNYSAKNNAYIWPFNSTPRPTFRTCWLYRNSIIEKNDGIESVALSLRIIWHCIRWDDMANKPSSNTITTETEIISSELLKRRDLAPFGSRSEYLVRKIIVPIEFDDEKDDNEWREANVRLNDFSTGSKRTGLRERKKKMDDSELRKQGPSVTETWTPEEELQLWEIRGFSEKLEKQQQMIKERERIELENQEKARKQQEEQRLREERNKRLQNERAQRGQAKRVLTAQRPAANNSAANQQNQGPYAMIRTLGGQTYKIPVSALPGKKAGDEVTIKTGSQSSQFMITTKATIMSISSAPTTTVTTNKPQTTTVSSTSTVISNTIVRPLIISGGSTTNLATGISASSLQQQQTITQPQTNSTSIQSAQPPRIQLISKQTINPATSQPQPQSQITTSIPTTATTTTTTAPATNQPQQPTIRLVPQQSNSQTQIQIPLKLPDGRMQIIQLPASVLNSSTPIQIQIPQRPAPGSNVPTTIIRTIQTVPQSSLTTTTQIRTITPNQLSSIAPAASTPVVRTIQSAPSPQIIRTIAPVPSNSASQPIIRTITSAPNNTIQQLRTGNLPIQSIVQKPAVVIPEKSQPVVKPTPAPVATPSKPTKATKQQSTSSNTKSDQPSKNSTTTNQLSLSQNKPLLQHQLLDDQLNQSDNLVKVEESSFKLTPQFKQEMVKRALSSKTNTPEIQQKLLALQKHTQLQAGGSLIKESNQSTSLRRSTAGGLTRGTLTGRQSNHLQSIGRSSLSSLSSSKGMEEERDDIVVKTIIKAMIDRIEKDEKLEIKRKKARENQLQAKWRQMNSKQNLKLIKNSDLIKKEMLKRRALYQKNCKEIVDEEIRNVRVRLSIKVDGDEHVHYDERNSSTRNSSGGENSGDSNLKPFGGAEERNVEQQGEGEENGRSMQKHMKREVYVNSRYTSGKGGEMAPVNSSMARSFNNSNDIGAGCYKSMVVVGKRKSTSTGTLSHNNNKTTKNLNDDNRSKFNSTARIRSETNQVKRTANSQADKNSRKRRKLKHPKLISNCLSENQFNNQFFDEDDEMDTQIDQQTGQVIKQKRLYCICRQPYDSKRFMVGCDICHNWFHCDCLKIEEDQVKKLASYICQNCRDTHGSDLDDELDEEDYIDEDESDLEKDDDDVDDVEDDEVNQPNSKLVIDTKVNSSSKRKLESSQYLSNNSPNKKIVQQTLNGGVKGVRKATQQQQQPQQKSSAVKKEPDEQEEDDDELYCICRTPYNESQFYIQCEASNCGQWLHGKCIGLLSKEADKIDVYMCPQCEPSSLINYANQKKLDSKDYDSLKKLLKSIQQHRNAWPFLKPVDSRQVPDYYQIIKEPMDLGTIEENLNKQTYPTLTKFIGDVTQIFDNCHYYNDSKSSIVHCANILENFFVQKIKQFRQQINSN